MPRDKIFISYRRNTDSSHAQGLRAELSRSFPGRVFLDVSSLEPGEDFEKSIHEELQDCCAFIAVIGPDWTTVKNRLGVRRLDDPRDLLAAELATALDSGVLVIPVLVSGAQMPEEGELPARLRKLVRLNEIKLSHEHWEGDVARIETAIRKRSGSIPAPRGGTRRWVGPSLLLIVVGITIGIIYFVNSPPHEPQGLASGPFPSPRGEKVDALSPERKANDLIAVLPFDDLGSDSNPSLSVQKELQVSLITRFTKLGLKALSPHVFNNIHGGNVFEEAKKRNAKRLVGGQFRVAKSGVLKITAWLTDPVEAAIEVSVQAEGDHTEVDHLGSDLADKMAPRLRRMGLRLAMPAELPTRAPESEEKQLARNRALGSILDFEDEEEPIEDLAPVSSLDKAGVELFARARSVVGAAFDLVLGRAFAQGEKATGTGSPEARGTVVGDAVTASATTSVDEQIRARIEHYCDALRRGDLEGIAESRGKLSDRQRTGLEGYFASAEDLQVTCTDIDVYPVTDGLYAVSYLRRDEFRDGRTGERVDLEVRLENAVVLDEDGRWLIRSKKLLKKDS